MHFRNNNSKHKIKKGLSINKLSKKITVKTHEEANNHNYIVTE